MVLFKRYPDFKSGGDYGMIFFHSGVRAVKVFKKNSSKPEKHIEDVFLSEVRAYRIAQSVPGLKDRVPEFYDIVKVDRIMTGSGDDISDQFYLHLAYEMEKVHGEFRPADNSEAMNEIRKLMHANGIMHTTDMDAWVEDGIVMKVIDFAVQEFPLSWD